MKIVMTLTTAQAMENQVAIVSMWEHLPYNVMFVIRNRNTFDAYDVRLEADGCEPVVLGDMAKGASRKFEFVAAVLGRADNVIISWLDSPQATERMGLPMAMPERR